MQIIGRAVGIMPLAAEPPDGDMLFESKVPKGTPNQRLPRGTPGCHTQA